MAKKTILLAEDEALIASLYKLNFEKKGAEVVLARKGNEALEILKKMTPDVLLLDLLMPEVNGFDVLKSLAEDKKKKFPIIMMTNLSQQSDKKECMALGGKEYLIKSDLSADEIWTTVEKYL